ncbi:MAG: DNA polymerase III subunit delta [Gammaproteobacteria bacterium]|nr:DNA polymerase III subunit delta [Gammaproteobacteria bacterium]
MPLNADQLAGQLKRGLASVYLISGDDPLTTQECADAIRTAAQAAGFGNRELYTVESGFDWSALYADTRSGSLFAARRLIELRLPTAKPGEEGAKTLVELAADPSPDLILLVIAGKLDKQAKSAKWVTALDNAGVMITIYPVEPRQLPAWIERRMRARGLTPGPGVTEMLAHYTEGNMLACAQEIDKLAMLDSRQVSADDIAGNLSDNARFSVYALTDACLAGDVGVVLRILRSLKTDGEAPALVLWALVREIRELARIAAAIVAGRNEAQVLDEYRVWQRRKPLVQKVLRRTPADAWPQMIRAAARADRVVKGRRAGDVWLELELLALALGGLRSGAFTINGAMS